jgi:hypothetical protein
MNIRNFRLEISKYVQKEFHKSIFPYYIAN